MSIERDTTPVEPVDPVVTRWVVTDGGWTDQVTIWPDSTFEFALIEVESGVPGADGSDELPSFQPEALRNIADALLEAADQEALDPSELHPNDPRRSQ